MSCDAHTGHFPKIHTFSTMPKKNTATMDKRASAVRLFERPAVPGCRLLVPAIDYLTTGTVSNVW